MAEIVLDHVSKVYPSAGSNAVADLNLDIGDGEFIVLVGPSGCGKTTALRMVAGLESITDGTISIGDRVVNTVPPKERDIAMVFQNYALYPHMTVYDNMAFGLKLRKVPKTDIDRRVREAAGILGLEEFLERKPKALSGGQRQRVAMGRAIVREPKAFLMDEPLSNLDAKLRVSTRSQIAGLQRRLGITTVYVTHDQVEAMTMGHRVAVLRDGRLQQVGTPEELYDQPVNTFVASFIGSPAITLVEAQVREGVAEVHGARIPLDRAVAGKAGERVVVGLRPESWHLVDAGADNGVDLKVELVEALGSESFIYGVPVGAEQGDGVASQRVTVHSDKRVRPEVGEVVHVVPEPSEAHVFSAETGERLTSA